MTPFFEYIVIILIVINIILFAFAKSIKDKKRQRVIKYKRVPFFFSKAEKSFYDVLNLYLNEDYIIFAKVRLADVLIPEKPSKYALYKVLPKHVDFILCDKQHYRPIIAIELDDKSHYGNKNDIFKNKAFESANIKLIRIKVKASYTKKDIEKILNSINIKNNYTSYKKYMRGVHE